MKNESTQMKLILVPTNGQISIGKQWAGRHIAIKQVSETELRIVSGSFVPDNQETFFSTDAKHRLNKFDHWSEENPPKKTDLNALKKRLAKKAR